MNEQDIIELAKECGFQARGFFEKQLTAFVNALIENEREQCALICDYHNDDASARRIRARSVKVENEN